MRLKERRLWVVRVSDDDSACEHLDEKTGRLAVEVRQGRNGRRRKQSESIVCKRGKIRAKEGGCPIEPEEADRQLVVGDRACHRVRPKDGRCRGLDERGEERANSRSSMRAC